MPCLVVGEAVTQGCQFIKQILTKGWLLKCMNWVGLATSCSRFPKKLPEISQKVTQKLLKKKSKVAFCNESCAKVAKNSRNIFCFSLLLFGLMQKYAICTTKVTFRSIFVQLYVVTSVAKLKKFTDCLLKHCKIWKHGQLKH